MIRGTSTVAVTGLAIVVALTLLALAAPLVLPGSPTEIASGAALRAVRIAVIGPSSVVPTPTPYAME